MVESFIKCVQYVREFLARHPNVANTLHAFASALLAVLILGVA